MAAASSWSFQTFPFPVKRIGMAWKDQKNLLGRSWKLQENKKPGWGLGLGEMQMPTKHCAWPVIRGRSQFGSENTGIDGCELWLGTDLWWQAFVFSSNLCVILGWKSTSIISSKKIHVDLIHICSYINWLSDGPLTMFHWIKHIKWNKDFLMDIQWW